MNSTNTKWVLGHEVTVHDTTGDFDLMYAVSPPKAQGPPPHLHQNFKESFLIVEGELDFFIDGKVKTVGAGESVDIPPNTLHTFNNNSDAVCKWINIHSPKGFRAFFEMMGVDASQQNAKADSLTPERVQQVISTAAQFDMVISLPK